MKLAVVPNYHSEDGAAVCKTLCASLDAMGVLYRVTEDTAFPPADLAEVLVDCDIVVALGGDGTIIHCAKQAAVCGKPILGINSGRLGFTAGLERNEWDRLGQLLRGEYTVENRMMLEVTAPDGTVYHALNEVVVSRGALSRMVELEVSNHGSPVISYQADGVILSTPTGSTAYSLSAGGPVVDPTMHCLLMTPVCPHSLYGRSYLFDDTAVLTVRPSVRNGVDVFATVDGEQAIPIPEGGELSVRRASLSVELIRLTDRSFFDDFYRKLMNRKG